MRLARKRGIPKSEWKIVFINPLKLAKFPPSDSTPPSHHKDNGGDGDYKGEQNCFTQPCDITNYVQVR